MRTKTVITSVLAAALACAPADDAQGPDDGGSGADATGDGHADETPPLDDGATPPDDAAVPDDAADPPDDGGPPPDPFCRYECAGDETCTSVYGAGYVCREATVTVERYCQKACAGDADCRSGAASDPLMLCREGVCTMRACANAGECSWIGTNAACREVSYGTIRSCYRPCTFDADCRYGIPADVLMRCRSGMCTSGCDTDNDCRTAFGIDGYVCRPPPTYTPGPSCVRDCAAATDCFLGAPSDVMAVCR